MGAGVSGLTSAIVLAEHGFDVNIITKELPVARLNIRADGGRLDHGSISFDEFYCQFKNETAEVKTEFG